MTPPVDGAARRTSRPRVEVTIDEVILRGVPPEQARAVLAALEARIGELAAGWIATSDGDDDAARFGDGRSRHESGRRLPDLGTAGSPAGLGVAVADAVWADLSSGGRPARHRAGTAGHGRPSGGPMSGGTR